jgi:hypothetical protein
MAPAHQIDAAWRPSGLRGPFKQLDSKIFWISTLHTIINKSSATLMIDSTALIEIWEEAFKNADYLHQRYPSEGRPREIAINALMPSTRIHPMAI